MNRHTLLYRPQDPKITRLERRSLFYQPTAHLQRMSLARRRPHPPHPPVLPNEPPLRMDPMNQTRTGALGAG